MKCGPEFESYTPHMGKCSYFQSDRWNKPFSWCVNHSAFAYEMWLQVQILRTPVVVVIFVLCDVLFWYVLGRFIVHASDPCRVLLELDLGSIMTYDASVIMGFVPWFHYYTSIWTHDVWLRRRILHKVYLHSRRKISVQTQCEPWG